MTIVVQPNQPFLKDYQQNRILAWLEPEKYATDEAYQQINSVMAIGSGQLSGKGYNSNTTTSVKNGNFISEPQTDFIFAIIGEELGFVGCCVVIILLLLIVIDVYFDWSKGKGHCGAPYMRRSRHTDRSSDVHQHQCGYTDFPEYRDFPAICKCRSHIHYLLLHGNWLCAQCRFAA